MRADTLLCSLVDEDDRVKKCRENEADVILYYYCYRSDETVALYVHSSPSGEKNVFVTEIECVYCAVRSKYLYIIRIKFTPQGINLHEQDFGRVFILMLKLFL